MITSHYKVESETIAARKKQFQTCGNEFCKLKHGDVCFKEDRTEELLNLILKNGTIKMDEEVQTSGGPGCNHSPVQESQSLNKQTNINESNTVSGSGSITKAKFEDRSKAVHSPENAQLDVSGESNNTDKSRLFKNATLKSFSRALMTQLEVADRIKYSPTSLDEKRKINKKSASKLKQVPMSKYLRESLSTDQGQQKKVSSVENQLYLNHLLKFNKACRECYSFKSSDKRCGVYAIYSVMQDQKDQIQNGFLYKSTLRMMLEDKGANLKAKKIQSWYKGCLVRKHILHVYKLLLQRDYVDHDLRFYTKKLKNWPLGGIDALWDERLVQLKKDVELCDEKLDQYTNEIKRFAKRYRISTNATKFHAVHMTIACKKYFAASLSTNNDQDHHTKNLWKKGITITLTTSKVDETILDPSIVVY